MKIVIGSDHTGVALKAHLIEKILADHVWLDVGTDSSEAVDYPDIAHAAVRAIRTGEAECGILICGTGIGMAMAAGRYSGIRAATCVESYCAEMSRRHNDANVLCLGARVLGIGLAEQIARTWLGTPFEGGRHARRVGKLENRPQGGERP